MHGESMGRNESEPTPAVAREMIQGVALQLKPRSRFIAARNLAGQSIPYFAFSPAKK